MPRLKGSPKKISSHSLNTPLPNSIGAKLLRKRMMTEGSTSTVSSSTNDPSNETWRPSTDTVVIRTSSSSDQADANSKIVEITSEKKTPTPFKAPTRRPTLKRQNAEVGANFSTLPRRRKISSLEYESIIPETTSSNGIESAPSRKKNTTRRATTSIRGRKTTGSLMSKLTNGWWKPSDRCVVTIESVARNVLASAPFGRGRSPSRASLKVQ